MPLSLTYGPSSEERAEWLAARREVVTATDVARLASGGSKVWARIKAEKKAEEDGSFFTPAMRWGVEREPIIAGILSDDWQHNTHLIHHRERPEFAATPDLVHRWHEWVADIKVAKFSEDWEPPQRYVDQVQWQMYMCDAEDAYLFVEFYEESSGTFWPLPQVKSFPIQRDDERIEYLVGLADSFIDGSEEVSDLDVLLVRYADADAQVKAAQAVLKEAKSTIEEHIADKDAPFKYVSDFGSISLSADYKKQIVDVPALRKEQPEIAELYTKTTAAKGSLRITIPKETP